MQLHAACAALPAWCLRLSCVCLAGLKGIGATRAPSRTHGSALQPQQRRRRSASLRKMARARGRAPGTEQKQVAESGAALHEFIYALQHHPPLSFSLLCSYPAPPPPTDSPLNVALRCLPCLLLSSSRFPCKRTNNKKSTAFKSARSFSLHCPYSRS
jgi:hypothetical protein